jgi:imidazolonepropionase-like amidohydrolase
MRTLLNVLKKLSLTIAAVLALTIASLGTAYYFSDWYKPSAQARQEIVIRGGTLFDAVTTQAQANPGLVLRDGKIACIGATCAASDDAVQINAAGLAIVPGLIDLHGHFLSTENSSNLIQAAWQSARLQPQLRRSLHAAGVTSYRSLGDPDQVIFDAKRMLTERELAGPRLFVVGPIFTAPGGHPAYGGKDPNASGIGGFMTFQSDDPVQIQQKIAQLAAQGADGIKAVFYGNYDAATQRRLPMLQASSFQALIAASKQHGLWVAVHVGPADDSRQAAELGATSIEHGVRNGNVINNDTLTALVQHQVVYVPTLGHEPGAEVNIAALYAAGVTIGVGTDVGDYHDELARLQAAGMLAADVLVAATRNGAKALHQQEQLGTIEVGKLADVVLVQGEPWQQISDLRQVQTVIQDGYVVFTAQ